MEGQLDEPAAAAFFDEVDKQIIEEAPASAWHHPRPGDVAVAEVGGGDALGNEQTLCWRVGAAGISLSVGGVDLDRCIRTMRLGEVASLCARAAPGTTAAARVRLAGLEREDDLLGDGRLVRVTVQDGDGWQTPQAGTEARVRFAWRVLLPGGERGAAAGPAAEAASDAPVVLMAGAAAASAAELRASREMGDLQRLLLRLFGGTVISRVDAVAPGPPLRIVRGGQVLVSSSDSGHQGLAAMRRSLEAGLGAQREAREVAMSMEEGRCMCSAEDWLPGIAGLRVLTDMRTGQRCLIRVASDLAFGAQGLPHLSVPPNAALEYEVELLRVMALEDLSFDRRGGIMKKTTREGEDYDRPAEGAEVTLRLEARDDSSGAVLVEEREVTFSAASGRFCVAVDETVLTMKKGEACEVRCTDIAACSDVELGLHAGAGTVVVLNLELLAFSKVDVYTLPEPDKVAHCSKRKEVGSQFFQDGDAWRALRRYQHVTNVLAYLDHWVDVNARAEALALRRVCHLNTAACLLKLEAWAEAEKACSVVLKEEPDNVKALFRRGRALQELGEYREAEQSLRKVLEMDRENKEVARLLVKLRQSVRDEIDHQKEVFARMARGIGNSPDANNHSPVGHATASARGPEPPSPDADEGAWPVSSGWMVALALSTLAAAGLAVLAHRRSTFRA